MRNVCLSEYDFISLSETWLLPNVTTSELVFNNYTTHRHDRNSNTSNWSRDGGVLLSVNNKYCSLSDANNVSVNKSDFPLLPCNIYHPGLLISFPITIINPIDYNFYNYNLLYIVFFSYIFPSTSKDMFNYIVKRNELHDLVAV
jgi:hypothetical protein